MIEFNQPVPDFDIEATSDVKGRLHDFLQGPIVLYFYPRDNTPGCAQESQDFTAKYAEFTKLGATIFGLSRDSLTSHEKFKVKYDMPFELISDTSEEICQLFDVIKDKNMYGKKYKGIERSTFIIDSNGVLRAEWRKVKIPNHVSEVLTAVKKLSSL